MIKYYPVPVLLPDGSIQRNWDVEVNAKLPSAEALNKDALNFMDEVANFAITYLGRDMPKDFKSLSLNIVRITDSDLRVEIITPNPCYADIDMYGSWMILAAIDHAWDIKMLNSHPALDWFPIRRSRQPGGGNVLHD